MGALRESETPYQVHLDREPVYNIWDNFGGNFLELKRGIKSGEIPIDEALRIGNDLLKSTDPASVKTGIHVYRLAMWEEPTVAKTWIALAPDLFKHSHPRIRHSVIWNLRTAAWQDPRLASFGLPYAQEGLNDPDGGVQRASVWAHGDFVINELNLFDAAYKSLNKFLEDNPRESNYLFALERFFKSLKLPFGEDPRFHDSIQKMIQQSKGYPGLRARCVTVLGENVNRGDIENDKQVVTAKLEKSTQGTPLEYLVYQGAYTDAFINTVKNFQKAKTFTSGMDSLRLMKYLAWLSDELQQPFELLGDTLTDKRDGDLARSASVVLTECAIQQPDQLAHPAAETVKRFYNESDIDGSQIVVQLVLDPVRLAGQDARQVVAKTLPYLYQKAANRSVLFALGSQ